MVSGGIVTFTEPQENHDQGKYSEILRDLTVVIFTRNRLNSLRGVVKYWSQWPVSLLILDGSDEPIQPDFLDLGIARAEVYSALDIGERFLFAASNIKTNFACLHSDDDFTIARGAARAIEWLGNNPDYICVSSDVQLFDSKLSTCSAPPGKWVTADTPRNRLVEHLSDYRFSYFYGIQRTPPLCAALKAVNAATNAPAFIAYPNSSIGYELGLEICGATLGRLAKSPEVLLLKQVGNESPWAGSQIPKDWLEDPRAQAAVFAWRSALSSEMSTQIGCNADTLDDWIVQALNRYCEEADAQLASKSLGFRLVRSIAMWLRPSVFFEEATHTSSSGRIGLVRSAHHMTYTALRSGFRGFTRHLGLIRDPMTEDFFSTNADPLDLLEIKSILERDPT